MLRDLKQALLAKARPERALASARFFKTAKGQYGENDKFLGVTVPDQRVVAKRFKNLGRSDLSKLLHSRFHEHRLTALLILVGQYRMAVKQGHLAEQKALVGLYLRHLDRVNNWDLVDSSAPQVLGEYLVDKPRGRLYRLARSKDLWRRRVAILSTAAFIRRGDFSDTLSLCESLLHDREDLIHKGTGWMLREVGNRSPEALRGFLDRHAARMPRTMLRYAIEKLDERTRKAYLGRRTGM